MCHTSPQAVGQNRYSYLISSSGDNKETVWIFYKEKDILFIKLSSD